MSALAHRMGEGGAQRRVRAGCRFTVRAMQPQPVHRQLTDEERCQQYYANNPPLNRSQPPADPPQPPLPSPAGQT